MMMGGDSGATQHAINTYGGIGAQHAVSATDHTIAMNHTGGMVAVPAVITGGGHLAPAEYGGNPIIPKMNGGDGEATMSPSESMSHAGSMPHMTPMSTMPSMTPTPTPTTTGGDNSKIGGGIITDIAVPAVLLYARDSIRKGKLMGLPSMGQGTVQGKTFRKARRFRRGRRSSRRGRR